MNTYKVEGDRLVESDVPAVVLSRQWIVRRERVGEVRPGSIAARVRREILTPANR